MKHTQAVLRVLRAPLLLIPLLLLAWPALLTVSRATASESDATETIVLSEDLEIEPLEPRLWLYRASHVVEPWGRIPSNGLVVGGPDGVIVVDTPWSDELTELLLDWAEGAVGPVHAVAATHFHHDRLGGVETVHARGIESWGQRRTAELAPTVGLSPPKRLVDETAELTTAGEPIELFYPGAAHTVDNLVVWFPERKLLYGGCMVKSAHSKSAGNLEDADLEAWPASLDRIRERYPEIEVVVPGHGRRGGANLLEHTEALAEAARGTDRR